jgi:hypothetical protein
VREALKQLDPLWDQLSPAEQARIIGLPVERVEVGPAGAAIQLRVAGLAGLVGELGSAASQTIGAAARAYRPSLCRCRFHPAPAWAEDNRHPAGHAALPASRHAAQR